MLLQEVLLPCFMTSGGGGQSGIGFVLLVYDYLVGVLAILFPQTSADGGIADSIQRGTSLGHALGGRSESGLRTEYLLLFGRNGLFFGL
jgi:hypothetical protein